MIHGFPLYLIPIITSFIILKFLIIRSSIQCISLSSNLFQLFFIICENFIVCLCLKLEFEE